MLNVYLHCIYEIKLVNEEIKKAETTSSKKIMFSSITEIMQELDERIEGITASARNFQMLDLIYFTRVMLFAAIDRPYECGYWLISRAKLLTIIPDKYKETLN